MEDSEPALDAEMRRLLGALEAFELNQIAADVYVVF